MADIVVTWTPFALRCLDEIHYYLVQEASTSVAEKFIQRIFDRTSQLKKFPESGQDEIFLNEKGLNSRYLIEGNYKIIYEYQEREQLIVIIDVFHTNQNPEKILNR